MCAQDERIVGINLFRNFGQHLAISAGLSYVSGDWVIVMDGDLQDLPEELPKLYGKIREGYDAVFARRVNRQDSWFKRTCSWGFNALLEFLSGTKHDATVANFSIISRQVADSVSRLQERHRSYGLLISWLGPKIAFVDVAHGKRTRGVSSYSFCRQLRLALDLVVSYSSRPLVFSVFVGFFSSVAAVVYIGYLLFGKLAYGYGVEGWASTMVSVWLFGGLILTQLGIIGLYLGKIFEQIKGRPLFLVRETLNDANSSGQIVADHCPEEAR
jgi:dolichol-phosphate mannosyltransferase